MHPAVCTDCYAPLRLLCLVGVVTFSALFLWRFNELIDVPIIAFIGAGENKWDYFDLAQLSDNKCNDYWHNYSEMEILSSSNFITFDEAHHALIYVEWTYYAIGILK